MIDRRTFLGALTVLAGVVMPKTAQASASPAQFRSGVTGITHVFLGPTGPVDYRLLGNLHRSFEFRGQSLMSPESLAWMRRHYGIVHTPYAERDKYVPPEEYVYRDGFFNLERARAAWRADNIAEGRDPEYCLHFLR